MSKVEIKLKIIEELVKRGVPAGDLVNFAKPIFEFVMNEQSPTDKEITD